MFTGLIEATGRIARVAPHGAGRTLELSCPFAGELAAGDSVAVNGVCLTAATVTPAAFTVQISPETLRVTTLGEFGPGRLVNLERPLRADARLGGHFVLGHVDACGRVAAITQTGDYHWIDVEYPATLGAWLIPKGSIAVDGISLTIAALVHGRLGVQIVPFTWANTALSAARPGDAVNLEADVIGKYVARLYEIGSTSPALGGEGRES